MRSKQTQPQVAKKQTTIAKKLQTKTGPKTSGTGKQSAVKKSKKQARYRPGKYVFKI